MVQNVLGLVPASKLRATTARVASHRFYFLLFHSTGIIAP